MGEADVLEAVARAVGRARDTAAVADLVEALGLAGKAPATRVMADAGKGGAAELIYADFAEEGLSWCFRVPHEAGAPAAVLEDVWCFAEGVEGYSRCRHERLLPPLAAKDVVNAHGEPAKKGGGGPAGPIFIEYHGYAGVGGLNATIEFVAETWDDADSPIRSVVFWKARGEEET
eukprot:TRINITY_DN20825_c0_g1_i1.p2 TRINITY_DN20825_c0_g1~~TRINITY_DN20825_c0_g1_i1.p2  ORF type:complete len:175 (+),score=56.91 TRINITY_DN20825_c0_g1_i1:55-579(+)